MYEQTPQNSCSELREQSVGSYTHHLIDQLAADVKKVMYSKNLSMARLAEIIEVSDKTLRNIVNKSVSRPQYSTVIGIYQVLFETNHLSSLINLVPKVIKEYIVRVCPEPELLKNSYEIDQTIKKELLNDVMLLRVYHWLTCEIPITPQALSIKLGEEGRRAINRLLELDAAKVDSNGNFVLGSKIVLIEAELAKAAMVELPKYYFKPQNCEKRGYNYIQVGTEGVNLDAWVARMKIQMKAEQEWNEYKKNNPQYRGNIQMMTINAMDTLSTNSGPQGIKEHLQKSQTQERGALQ